MFLDPTSLYFLHSPAITPPTSPALSLNLALLYVRQLQRLSLLRLLRICYPRDSLKHLIFIMTSNIPFIHKAQKGQTLPYMLYYICLPHIIFPRGNSTAPTPHRTSQQLNPPSFHQPRHTQLIQPFPQSCAGVCAVKREFAHAALGRYYPLRSSDKTFSTM